MENKNQKDTAVYVSKSGIIVISVITVLGLLSIVGLVVLMIVVLSPIK